VSDVDEKWRGIKVGKSWMGRIGFFIFLEQEDFSGINSRRRK
jgi:hypothetical protein